MNKSFIFPEQILSNYNNFTKYIPYTYYDCYRIFDYDIKKVYLKPFKLKLLVEVQTGYITCVCECVGDVDGMCVCMEWMHMR